jgi:hypothetical protein
MKKSVVITLAAATLIVVAALATLGVLTAFAGEKSGLEKSNATRCGHMSAADFRDVSDPNYGMRLAELARCRTSNAR